MKGDGNAHLHKVFRHFQTDKAAASQNSGFRLLIRYKTPDTKHLSIDFNSSFIKTINEL